MREALRERGGRRKRKRKSERRLSKIEDTSAVPTHNHSRIHIPPRLYVGTAMVSPYNNHLKMIFCLPPRFWFQPQWYLPAFKIYFLAITAVVSRTAVVSPYNTSFLHICVSYYRGSRINHRGISCYAPRREYDCGFCIQLWWYCCT